MTDGPIETMVYGHPAWRFEITIPADDGGTICTDGVHQLWPGMPPIAAGETLAVHIVDVDGIALGIVGAIADPDSIPALVGEVHSIVADMIIEH